MNRAPIVLTTDFGLEDPYVGVMKGVIYGINLVTIFLKAGVGTTIRMQDLFLATRQN